MGDNSMDNLRKTLSDNKGLVLGATAAVLAPVVILPVVGFTATGVGAGSLAAGTQSVVYGGLTTGIFSLCQSAGVVGVPLMTKTGLVIGGGLLGHKLQHGQIKTI